jgi:hypothetical protein
MWDAPMRGELTGSYIHIQRMIGATTPDLNLFLSEAKSLLFCDISVTDNENVTVRNRRMWRDEKDRKNNRERQERFRDKRQNNKQVTPPSPSPSPSPKKNNHISKIIFEDGKFKTVPDALMEKWREVAPGINIPAELKKAELWLLANPEKRRSRWGAFLSTWMVRAQDNFIKYGGNNGGIRTARSDRDDKTLQSRTDAEVADILRRRDIAKKSPGNQTGGNAGNDDAPDF